MKQQPIQATADNLSLVDQRLNALDQGEGGDTPRPANILAAMEDPEWFKDFFEGPSWDGWKAFLAAVFGLPMTPEMLVTYQRFTGRHDPPTRRAREAWMIVGRRGGKTRISALIAVYLAIFRDYTPYLAPGEKATIPIISSDTEQTRQAMGYIKNAVAGLAAYVAAGPAWVSLDISTTQTAEDVLRKKPVYQPSRFG